MPYDVDCRSLVPSYEALQTMEIMCILFVITVTTCFYLTSLYCSLMPCAYHR